MGVGRAYFNVEPTGVTVIDLDRADFDVTWLRTPEEFSAWMKDAQPRALCFGSSLDFPEEETDDSRVLDTVAAILMAFECHVPEPPSPSVEDEVLDALAVLVKGPAAAAIKAVDPQAFEQATIAVRRR